MVLLVFVFYFQIHSLDIILSSKLFSSTLLHSGVQSMASTCGTVLMVLQGRFTKLLSLVVQELPSRLKYHSLGLSNLRTGNPRAGSLGIGNLRMGHLRVDNLGIDNPRAGLLGAGNPDIVNLRASSLVMDNLKIDNPPKKFKLVLKS